MNLHVHTAGELNKLAVDSLLVFYPEGQTHSAELDALNEALGGEIQALFAEKEATGQAGSVAHVRTRGRIQAKHVLLVGLGAPSKLNAEAVRQAAGAASRQLIGTTVGVVLYGDEFATATVEGLLLGRYSFKGYKTDKKTDGDQKLHELYVAAKTDVTQAVAAAQINADAVVLARDLTNTPANLLDPVQFADLAAETAQAVGLSVEVFDEKQLREMGMNLLLAVGNGSDIPPRMVVLRHNGAPDSKEVLGLVGKGITFDTGGYIIKPESGMGDMKTDMGGAACVLGAMQAIARKKLAVNAIGVLVLAENMISGRAFKPSDVAVAYNGKTVEMIDTDCEGRLVLADGVAYVKQLGATRIVDTATLTGAVFGVLGYEASSLYGNDDAFVEQVKQAGAEVGERFWALPNYPEYHKLIESDIADYINYSGRNASALAGGVFIAAFADEVPFVHIDMANTARAKSTKGYTVEGGTGFSTRTLIALAESLA